MEQFIRFDDRGTRPERWEEDKYAAIRENFEILHMQNAKMHGPSKCISADEILCSRIGIKQETNQNLQSVYYRKARDGEFPYTYMQSFKSI